MGHPVRKKRAPILAPKVKTANVRLSRPGIAPSVPDGFDLPYAIDDWYLMGKNWYAKGCYDFFADIATHPWEDPRVFGEGALLVVSRLRQASPFPPFREGKWPKRLPFKTSGAAPLDRERLGLIRISGEISLLASNREICKNICVFINNERRRLKKPYVSQRPVNDKNLERDLIVFLLDREGWDRPSIEAQLAFMGCVPLPNTGSQKVLVRKIRARFALIEANIVEETHDYRTRLREMALLSRGPKDNLAAWR